MMVSAPHRQAVSFLLSLGVVDIDAVDRQGFTPLHDAVEMKADLEFLAYLKVEPDLPLNRVL